MHHAVRAPRNPKPEARSLKPEIRNPEPGTRNPKPETRSPKPEARSPKPETRNPKPETSPGVVSPGSRTSCAIVKYYTLSERHWSWTRLRCVSNPGCQLNNTTQRATKGFSAQIGPPFRFLIRRNPPIPLQVTYRRVLGLVA
ncbi:hypothetical protein T484DRAFT_1611582 [Baffinella frigidus]|nr:hypothetical protein T484DRAFT_1611582 [Cryptophyta sp. CCMP2293]